MLQSDRACVPAVFLLALRILLIGKRISHLDNPRWLVGGIDDSILLRSKIDTDVVQFTALPYLRATGAVGQKTLAQGVPRARSCFSERFFRPSAGVEAADHLVVQQPVGCHRAAAVRA